MLTEVTVEMSDFNEAPVVSKSVHLVEEVLLRKELTTRTETILDTVRRDTLEIEQPSNLPAVIQAVPQQEQKKAEESTAEIQDKKHPVNSPPTGNRRLTKSAHNNTRRAGLLEGDRVKPENERAALPAALFRTTDAGR